jgi:hypothetical protein
VSGDVERLYQVTIWADIDDEAADALFDRVADAAHADGEQVTCSGHYVEIDENGEVYDDVHDAEVEARALREAVDAWQGGPTGAAPIPRWWLTDRADRVAGGEGK